MQAISSRLSLQSRYIKDKYDLELFTDCQSRVMSMALVHEKLYQSEDLDFRNTESFGLSFVCSLVGQLEWTIELDRSAGTKIKIKIRR